MQRPEIDYPPGSPRELERFAVLQAQLAPMFQAVVNDSRISHTAVIVPSLSLPQSELSKISGVAYYEERLLCMLMLLRQPRMRIVLVTSQPIHPTIIDYYLHLLAGVPGTHARRRLRLLSTYDSSPTALTEKILERRNLVMQIRKHISDTAHAHLVCFNSTGLERTLAVQLGIPLYAVDPSLLPLGTKTGSRRVFREAGVPLPPGYEGLQSAEEIPEALLKLKERYPEMRRAVVKLNDGFSGEGNALYRYQWVEDELDELDGASDHEDHLKIYRKSLEKLEFEAPSETWPHFAASFDQMGGIVEAFIEGEVKYSPSVQCRITPIGLAEPLSTHDQILGGPSGQVFLGSEFPAREDYRLLIQSYGQSIANVLKAKGVISRFGVDFVVVRSPETGGWKAYAIEINLRKGGTTHPFLMLKFLTDGRYYPSVGQFRSPTGLEKYYVATDNLVSPRYRGLRPDDLIDISVYHNIHFSAPAESGVVFHLIGSLSEFGKGGLTCIGNTLEEARNVYNRTLEILDVETDFEADNARIDTLPHYSFPI